MSEYPGVGEAIARYSTVFLAFALIEWVLELLGALVALVILLIWYPSGVGYFFVGLTALMLNNVGRMLDNGETEDGETVRESFEELENPTHLEIMSQVFGLYLVVGGMISGILLIATAAATFVGVYLGQSLLALFTAALVPVVDTYLGEKFGKSLSGVIGTLVGKTVLGVLRLYGIRNVSVEEFTDRRQFIQ
ncbi:hypothetical protein [Halorussus lipolyticus]|uniref:hypothetical protein n=1 Tax=Halorussus lipolyticus TaxID=3034024 RepID=UPI0023E7901B|nr:hypothetical protein [Halorussus sp. DT80]